MKPLSPKSFVALLPFALVALFAIGCGDDQDVPDAMVEPDAMSDRDATRPDADTSSANDSGANGADGDAGPPPNQHDGGGGSEAPRDAAVDADSIPVSRFCGDGIRDAVTEECDDGRGESADSCTAHCRVRSVPLVPVSDLADADAGIEEPARTLGTSSHTLAAGDGGFTLAYIEQEIEARVFVRRFDQYGNHIGENLEASSGLTPTAVPNPSVAALPGERYAIAWTDVGSGSPDVALRSFDATRGRFGEARLAHVGTSGPQQDVDLLWTGTQLIAAWTDLLDVYVRRFDEDLTPLEAETALASASALETSVTLAKFGQTGFAAAFRSNDDGSERIQVRADPNVWWTASAPPAAAGDRPALVELDDTHLLLVYTIGTDPNGSGTALVGRLRFAVLSTEDAGLVTSSALLPSAEPFASDLTLAQRRPRAVRVGSHLYVAWEHESPLGDAHGAELMLQEFEWSAKRSSLVAVAEHDFVVNAPHIGDQANPMLASSPLIPGGALVTAWEDRSGILSAGSTPSLVLALRPSPIVVLPFHGKQ